MYSATDLCSLDYLVGTLSTAYKGIITSLVTKDFCMAGDGGSTVFRGTVLSLPEGDYDASLIRAGVELGRVKLEQGAFHFEVSRDAVQEARDLQIDILQAGRHIGTFLLKKSRSDRFFQSAVELSDELKGLDLKTLTDPVRSKVGLLRKAEEIVTEIHSTRKDWRLLSERLNGFSTDLFWADRAAFYGAFPLIARFLRQAAERTGKPAAARAAGNFLASIELPLEQEDDRRRLHAAVPAWLRELNESSIDLAAQLRRSAKVLSAIRGRFPGADEAPALSRLMETLGRKLAAMPVLHDAALASIEGRIDREEFARLSGYGETRRAELLRRLAEAGPGGAPGFLTGLDPDLFDDGKMVTAVYETAARRIDAGSADAFAEVLSALFPLFSSLSEGALNAVKVNAPPVMEKLAAVGRSDVCGLLFDAAEKAGPPVDEELVLNADLAAAVLGSDDDGLIRRYRAMLRTIMIPAANVRAISAETWAEVVNPLHLERLTRFMAVLMSGDGRLGDILVQVIANLSVSGVFIPDDRLFQRTVSAYLNSGAMNGPFLLNCLFLRKLPVYYNEVGAVSRIRDYSTELDSWADDPVLYFVRKQVHVNASNYNVRLIGRVIGSWVSNDPSLLRDAVPADIYGQVKPELYESYAAKIRPFLGSLGVLDSDGLHLERLIDLPEERFRAGAEGAPSGETPAKIRLICKLYREIVKKYSLAGREAEQGDPAATLDRLKKLKAIVLSPDRTAAHESLYFKRHIAFGIPSVLGTYHEAKLDAMGEFLRNGEAVRVLFESVLARGPKQKSDFTIASIEEGMHALALAHQSLELHGLGNREVRDLVEVIRHNRLHLSQAADLLRMWQKELAWSTGYFSRTFHRPLTDLVIVFPKDDLPGTLLNLDSASPDFADKAADILIRDLINSVPGLVETDRMIERLLGAIEERLAAGRDEELGEGEEERRRYFSLFDLPDRDAVRLAPQLGGKAKNLAMLHNRGFRVPAGVVFPARLTPGYASHTERQEFSDALREAVGAIEKKTGAVFGGSANPLFLSVRSGSSVSMPGILTSLLYCGMNRETLEGFIRETHDARLAWDSYRRFIEHFGEDVLGLDRTVFEGVRTEVASGPAGSGAGENEELVRRYLRELSRRGLSIPGEVYEQLRLSVRAVYASWFSERARQFRRVTGTSEHWGTAVTIMEMVPGNADGAGASVFFTRDPVTLAPGAVGETRENSTGDDLVLGRELNRPLAKSRRGEGPPSLEETDAQLFTMHSDLAGKIEQAMGGLPQEVEAAYVGEPDGRRVIFVLQARRMEFRADGAASFDEICRMESKVIGRGIGANGGAVSGAATFARTPEEAARLGRERGLPVILLRTTANTDDVSLMPVIGGIVTSSGGVTSHAAVLAQKFGVNAVAACTGLVIKNGPGGPYAELGGSVIKEGASISIDGATGLVFSGLCLETTRAGRYR